VNFLTKQIRTMKKIATLLVFVSLAAGSYAQGLSGGLKVGLNLANQTIKSSGYTASPSFLPSFHGGAYLTFMFTEKVGLQPELLFSGQGYKSGDNKLLLSYIAIPVLVRYNVNDLLSFHAGPQVGILASAKEDYSGQSNDVKDEYKGIDMGIAIGATVDIKKLNFTFRFVKGLSDVADDSVDPDGDYKQKNYLLQLSAGYRLFGGSSK
jgi:hypothetical protein